MPATVEVYARAASVEVFVNGKSIGRKKMKKHNCRLLFQTAYEDGEITAVSYDAGGKEIGRQTLKTAEPDTVLQVRPERETVQPEGLVFISLQYTDNKGIWKPMEKHCLRVTVQNGTLEGLGSASPYVEGNYTDDTVSTYYGEAMAVVRAKENGLVKVTVTDERGSYTVDIPVKK